MNYRRFKILIVTIALVSCQEAPVNTTQVLDEPAQAIDLNGYGQEITTLAQAELFANVKRAMEQGGPAYTIEYCNIHATPLTDSISGQFKVSIQRLSLKNRNPENSPKSKEDKLLLNHYLESLNEGLSVKDTLVKFGDKTFYYRPIMIAMETCLKCHGQPGVDINNETMATLYRIYPKDKAINYRLGEFRGVWKVTFSEME